MVTMWSSLVSNFKVLDRDSCLVQEGLILLYRSYSFILVSENGNNHVSVFYKDAAFFASLDQVILAMVNSVIFEE